MTEKNDQVPPVQFVEPTDTSPTQEPDVNDLDRPTGSSYDVKTKTATLEDADFETEETNKKGDSV